MNHIFIYSNITIWFYYNVSNVKSSFGTQAGYDTEHPPVFVVFLLSEALLAPSFPPALDSDAAFVVPADDSVAECTESGSDLETMFLGSDFGVETGDGVGFGVGFGFGFDGLLFIVDGLLPL